MAQPPSSGGVCQSSNGLIQSSPTPLLSECGSDRNSETVDMDFLSPSQTPGELEDLPYKPCFSSSESLNIPQRDSKEHGHDGHKHRTKKKRSREKRKTRL